MVFGVGLSVARVWDGVRGFSTISLGFLELAVVHVAAGTQECQDFAKGRRARIF